MSVSNATAAPPPVRGLDVATFLVALGAIVGGAYAATEGWQWLHWVCKPLATVLILWAAWRADRPVSMRYRHWIAIGMLFSLVGDIFLMLPTDAFVAGLVAFLCGHVCFIRALLADTRFAAKPLALLACVAYGALNLWALWPALPAGLHVPVVLYVLVLTTMGGQAVARAWWHSRDDLAGPTQWAAAGALLFMLSDTLLAWNRFRLAIPLSALWILGTYYAALWCLARSIQRAGKHA